MKFFEKARNKALEYFIRQNEFILRFGVIQDVEINSKNASIKIRILLYGEDTPLVFTCDYAFFDNDEGVLVEFFNLSAERAWIKEALKFYSEKHRFKFHLPKTTGGLAKIFF